MTILRTSVLLVILLGGLIACAGKYDGGGCTAASCKDGSEQFPENGPRNGCATVNGEDRCAMLCSTDANCDPDFFKGCLGVDDNGQKYCLYY